MGLDWPGRQTLLPQMPALTSQSNLPSKKHGEHQPPGAPLDPRVLPKQTVSSWVTHELLQEQHIWESPEVAHQTFAELLARRLESKEVLQAGGRNERIK